MATTSVFPLIISAVVLLLHFQPSTSHPYRPKTSLYSTELSSTTTPTTYFEVTHPIPTPDTTPCSYLLLNHSFATTYNQPPVTVPYTPPTTCHSHSFSKIILEWNATATGRQFDRIFSIWLDGVELLRSCTAEPRPNGIFWKVEKDITKYHSLLLLSHKRTLAVYMGNIVDETYTGIYNANIAIHFYPSVTKPSHDFADVILPISRPLLPSLNDGLWYEIKNSNDVQMKNDVIIPRNAYRAVLELYVSFHENDEFWYSNYPSDYISANNLTSSSVPGNGPFREVVVTLDKDTIVGVVWPFTVIHTGGINPLLWHPITAIRSYDLPTYEIELTPMLGKMMDGENHTISFSVTNANNVWYVGGNLHIWIDKHGEKTEAGVVSSDVSPLRLETAGRMSGLYGTWSIRGSRSLKSTGWVKYSGGNMTTKYTQEMNYVNNMVIGHDGGMQDVTQKITENSKIVMVGEKDKLPPHIDSTKKSFSLKVYQDMMDAGLLVTNVSLGYDVDRKVGRGPDHYSISQLRNSQDASGNMLVKNGVVTGGIGQNKNKYQYLEGKRICYDRDVAVSRDVILHDRESNGCGKKH